MRKTIIALTVAVFGAVPSGEAAAQSLQPGEYEVTVRLELPHVDDNTARKITTVCLGEPDGATGFPHLLVLSDNNPLSKCPATGHRFLADELQFDIVCPGGNSARATARFVLHETRFEGRIDMKMGGKNMTMTESQIGRRKGACAGPQH